MKILVTGSNGRIGANLVRLLLGEGHEIRGFTYPGDASRRHKLDGFGQVEMMEGDLRDYAAVEKAVEGVDAVYHLAAAFGGPYNNIEYLEVNGGGTINLLEAIRARGGDVQRLIYASTEAIYWKLEEEGRLFEEPIAEPMVSATHRMPYFLTKWIGEELCMNYHLQYGIPTVVFRFSTVFEPSEFLSAAGMPRFCELAPVLERFRTMADPTPAQRETLAKLERAAAGGDKLLISRCPDGRSYKQEWCDVRDIARGLALGLEKDEAVGEAFTLGGLLTVWEEEVPALAERLGVGYTEARMPEANFFEFDHSKIERRLGYRAEHDVWSTLETALAMRRGQETGVIPTGVRYGGG